MELHQVLNNEEKYHTYLKAANDFHNSGVRCCIDGDVEGAMKRFALRDEYQNKALSYLPNQNYNQQENKNNET